MATNWRRPDDIMAESPSCVHHRIYRRRWILLYNYSLLLLLTTIESPTPLNYHSQIDVTVKFWPLDSIGCNVSPGISSKLSSAPYPRHLSDKSWSLEHPLLACNWKWDKSKSLHWNEANIQIGSIHWQHQRYPLLNYDKWNLPMIHRMWIWRDTYDWPDELKSRRTIWNPCRINVRAQTKVMKNELWQFS